MILLVSGSRISLLLLTSSRPPFGPFFFAGHPFFLIHGRARDPGDHRSELREDPGEYLVVVRLQIDEDVSMAFSLDQAEIRASLSFPSSSPTASVNGTSLFRGHLNGGQPTSNPLAYREPRTGIESAPGPVPQALIRPGRDLIVSAKFPRRFSVQLGLISRGICRIFDRAGMLTTTSSAGRCRLHTRGYIRRHRRLHGSAPGQPWQVSFPLISMSLRCSR